MQELLKKLQYHPSLSPVLSVNTPINFLPMLEVMGAEIHAHQEKDQYHYILLFMEEDIYFDQDLEKYSMIVPENGLLVLCYPKVVSGETYQQKLNQKFLWTALESLGFDAMSICDIDNKWQAIAYKKIRD